MFDSWLSESTPEDTLPHHQPKCSDVHPLEAHDQLHPTPAPVLNRSFSGKDDENESTNTIVCQRVSSSSWGPIDSFRWQNGFSAPQPGPRPTRNVPAHKRRFRPYEPNLARARRHANAEASQSTLPLSVPPIDLPMAEPCRGLSEVPTNTKTRNHDTEEETPVIDSYPSQIPRVSDLLFGVRTQNGLRCPMDKVYVKSTALGIGRTPIDWSDGRWNEVTFQNPRNSMMLLPVGNSFCSPQLRT